MRDYPRPLPPRSSRIDRAEKAAIGFGCTALLLWLVFWGTVIFVASHFIIKYW